MAPTKGRAARPSGVPRILPGRVLPAVSVNRREEGNGDSGVNTGGVPANRNGGVTNGTLRNISDFVCCVLFVLLTQFRFDYCNNFNFKEMGTDCLELGGAMMTMDDWLMLQDDNRGRKEWFSK
jgi:hypothetical protein